MILPRITAYLKVRFEASGGNDRPGLRDRKVLCVIKTTAKVAISNEEVVGFVRCRVSDERECDGCGVR